ncbi:hypothetical protein YTPLAS18_19380 [Nitrospira sp.]|nr:hypothetical protein YTPLAS18_19380 [Nitrospira sp.]
MSRQTSLIIGAGPAGLTAAYELSKHGVAATILEGSNQVGGISKTVNYRGYRFDIGGHRFFSKVPVINQLWKEILGDEFLLRPRSSRIYYNRHFFEYPLKPLNALIGLGPLESLLVALSYIKARFSHIHDERTFEDWVSNRFGYRLYNIFFKTYTEKVWGIPCTELSADWAAQRIKNLSLKQALRNALLSARRGIDGQTITSLIEEFHYPRFGPGMMWERCQERVAERGVPTLCRVKARQIHHEGGRVRRITGVRAEDEVVEFTGEQVISTMPLRELIFALDPLPPSPVCDAAARLRYRDYLTVVLVVDRDTVFPDNWIYIHSPDVKVGRIQNYKNWSPYMVPDGSKTSLGLEYFLWDKDDEWSWPDQQLIELGTRECSRLGLIDPREVVDGTVVRMEKAYPVYDQEYQRNVALIQEYLSTMRNLQTIGRNGLHRYNNQDHSMLTGLYAARNVLGEAWDVWSVNTEKEYHEQGHVAHLNPGDRLVPERVAVPVEADLDAALDRAIEKGFAHLDPLAMGTAIGTISAGSMLLVTMGAVVTNHPPLTETLMSLDNVLPGYQVSLVGAAVGTLEFALLGLGLGAVGAWLRNQGLHLYASLQRWKSDRGEQRGLLE